MAPLLLFILSLFSHSLAQSLTDRPIIGIVAQPVHNKTSEYIAASYVKWVEAGGGRAVPIPFKADAASLQKTFSSINGLLYPGGAGFTLSDSSKQIYDMAVAANKKGDFFPVWATCGGFETLLEWTGHGYSTLDKGFDSENISLPLTFLDAAKTSRLFSTASAGVMDILSSQPVTMNNHRMGIEPTTFQSNSNLTSFFQALSVNKDRKGRSFVSTYEAINMPIYGTQWHPEKNLFEMGMTKEGLPYEAINHDAGAVVATQFTTDFFVNECRKNGHSYASPAEEAAALIYNYNPSNFTYPAFVQSYEFTW